MTPNPTSSNIQAALRSFLLAILPDNTEVIAAQDNRVPEPKGSEFVVMTPMSLPRISTNIDDAADVKFTGSIAGAVLTVTAVAFGEIEVGKTIFGVGIVAGTKVIALGTGSGGVGTYTVSQAQTVASETISAGAIDITQPTMIVMQLDVHGPSSANNAQIISTLLRDTYAVEQFENQSPNYGVVPLYADDPRQLPFVNEGQQYEWRWVCECLLQANPIVQVPQQYADSVTVEVVSVDADFPPL